MSWISLSEVHRCQFPEYDHEDRRSVGTLWRCDEPWCGRIWRLTQISARPIRYVDKPATWNGTYTFALLDIEELHHWR